MKNIPGIIPEIADLAPSTDELPNDLSDFKQRIVWLKKHYSLRLGRKFASYTIAEHLGISPADLARRLKSPMGMDAERLGSALGVDPGWLRGGASEDGSKDKSSLKNRINAALDAYCKQSGEKVTVADLSKKFGNTVLFCVNQRGEFSTELAIKISDYLGCSFAWLKYGQDEEYFKTPPKHIPTFGERCDWAKISLELKRHQPVSWGEIAEQVGVADSALSLMRSGNRSFSGLVALGIARALQVSAVWLKYGFFLDAVPEIPSPSDRIDFALHVLQFNSKKQILWTAIKSQIGYVSHKNKGKSDFAEMMGGDDFQVRELAGLLGVNGTWLRSGKGDPYIEIQPRLTEDQVQAGRNIKKSAKVLQKIVSARKKISESATKGRTISHAGKGKFSEIEIAAIRKWAEKEVEAGRVPDWDVKGSEFGVAGKTIKDIVYRRTWNGDLLEKAAGAALLRPVDVRSIKSWAAAEVENGNRPDYKAKAQEYGVSEPAIRNAACNKSWRHL